MSAQTSDSENARDDGAIDTSRAHIENLAKHAMRGDSSAFEELCRCCAESILLHCYSFLGNKQDAQDAAQQVMISMYRKFGSLRTHKAYLGWMHTICKNTCLDMLKKRKHVGQELDSEVANDLQETKPDLLPQENLEHKESNAALMEAIMELPERRREALLMHYFDDMTFEQISKAMHISLGTATSAVARARTQLKEKLEALERQNEQDMNTGFNNNGFPNNMGGGMSGTATANAGGFVGLGAAMHNMASNMFPADSVNAVLSGASAQTKVIGSFAWQLLKSNILSAKGAVTGGCVAAAAAGCILGATLPNTAGQDITVNDNAPAVEAGTTQSAPVVNATVEFSGTESPYVTSAAKKTYIDPATAYAIVRYNGTYTVQWQVLNGSTQQVLLQGAGSTMQPGSISTLFTSGQYGPYDLRFSFFDSVSGQLISYTDADFMLSSNGVIPSAA
ncbi:MAG: RNA polymerase sigma factor [Coriobacteriales bacterium]|jgi:RNA polymerase sigma-70 factor (ECF subfamily)|nr:RNA polymerase sigma factor [Coriobacteriales bacterium]